MEEEHELVEIRLSGHWYDDASPHSLDERHFPVEVHMTFKHMFRRSATRGVGLKIRVLWARLQNTFLCAYAFKTIY